MATVTVITMWGEEEDLAPFFLRHYGWAQEIHVALDQTANDQTWQQLADVPSVTVSPFAFADGFDDEERSLWLSQMYGDARTDWVICVDADEYVCVTGDILDTIPADELVVKAEMANVYQHVTDGPLAVSVPVLSQRRHGVQNTVYHKPCVARTGLDGARWMVGQHMFYWKNEPVRPKRSVPGVHWAMADADIAVKRRTRMPERFSVFNRKNGFGRHNFTVTADQILFECEQHRHDPVVVPIEW